MQKTQEDEDIRINLICEIGISTISAPQGGKKNNTPFTKVIRNKLLKKDGYFSVLTVDQRDSAVERGSLVSWGRDTIGSWHGRAR